MPVESVKQLSTQIHQTEKTSTYQKTEPYSNDTVELSYSKNKQSKTYDWIYGAGAGLAMLALTGILFAKHQDNKISKLYKEKLIISKLPQKIEFKEAKTLEDGIKFAKEILGIKEIDKNFTLDAINIANKGLVDVSNANKGNLFMPTKLGFKSLTNENKDSLAYVVRDISSPNFGNMVINKNYFEHDVLNKEIKDLLYASDGKKFFNINTKTGDISTILKMGCVRPYPSKDLAKLAERFYKNSKNLNIQEKQILYYSLQINGTNALSTHRNPIWGLEQITKEHSDFLRKHNIKINFEELKKQKTEKQLEFLENIIAKMEKNKIFWINEYNIESPATVIYHEMGHLQDFAKNLKELDLKKWKFSFKKVLDNIKNNKSNRTCVNEVDNRWGTTSKEKYEKLLKDHPQVLKKLYPDLYEFLTNQEIQQTAGKISGYAQTGIGEFVAEVYARMISGKTLSDDIMTLYRKYKGPEIK